MNEVENLARVIKRAADEAVGRALRGMPRTYDATYEGTDSEGGSWVTVVGEEHKRPIHSASCSAAVGDRVRVTFDGTRLTMDSNVSNPSAGVATVDGVRNIAITSKNTAEKAIDYAGTASKAAQAAEEQAIYASEKAADALASSSNARRSAEAANYAARQATADAGVASDMAESATRDAVAAGESAGVAAEQARAATTFANNALDQLSMVQDVIGVLDWASKHGTFEPTEDESVQEGKVYFTYDSQTGDYAPVVQPVDEDIATYYELSVDEAMNDFILSHLAVTARGLWVLPNGVGSSDERHAPGYKMLLASDGAYLYDGSGALVRSDTADGTDFAEGKSFHFGSDDAYILYTPAQGSAPASLVIGGSNVQLGSGKTLAQWTAEMQRAVDDAADALETAQDGAHLVITSTAGQLFKNGSESTVLQVAVFPNGGGRLDTIADVRARFGAGAYIEWRWRHDAEGTWGTLSSDDPHLSQGGMWLTVTPEDVASKTSFEASLVTP